MISDFMYLWLNRELPVCFQRWVRVWLKRIYNLPATCFLLVRSKILRYRGAVIGRLVVLGKARIYGELRGLAIGAETALGRCEITLHNKVTIGRRVVINDGVLIFTASHSLRDPSWKHVNAPIVIGDYAWIASNAIVLPGVTIGRGAVVGAGAVVRENVEDYCVVIGNPARLISGQRSRVLDYSPVLLNAPFEAWIGINRPQGGEFDTL